MATFQIPSHATFCLARHWATNSSSGSDAGYGRVRRGREIDGRSIDEYSAANSRPNAKSASSTIARIWRNG